MKTILIFSLALFTFCKCEEVKYPRKRRGSFQSTYPLGTNHLQIGGVDVETYGKASIPLQETDLYAPGVGKFLSIPDYNEVNAGLPGGKIRVSAQAPQISHIVSQVVYPVSNNVDKPVREAQDYVPPQSVGTAIIPPVPPPATPVNAAASNVPANQGAVFLGSGSLGVIDLGGGAYALGSGSLGYSNMRSNPRSSFKSPLLPPVQASPNLVPAAVPSQVPQTPSLDFLNPYYGNPPVRDQNGYEFLPPNQVGFGDPLPPRPLKTTMSFATPTSLQIQQQPQPQLPALQPTAFGQKLPGFYQINNSYKR